MNFSYQLQSIFMGDGSGPPRATVRITVPEEEVPITLAVPSITIVMPLGPSNLGANLSACAASVLQAARQLVNEQRLADWVTGQASQAAALP